MLPIEQVAKRFWARVDKNGPMPNDAAIFVYPEIKGQRCWVWTGPPDKDGYGAMRAFPHPLRVTRVNRLAFFLEHGRWPEPCSLHKCDNVSCVRFSHLFEGTIDQNNKDRAVKGRSFKLKDGECHCTAKLNTEQVKAIRHRSGVSQRIIAAEFGVTQTTVSRIKLGQLWTHVGFD